MMVLLIFRVGGSLMDRMSTPTQIVVASLENPSDVVDLLGRNNNRIPRTSSPRESLMVPKTTSRRTLC